MRRLAQVSLASSLETLPTSEKCLYLTVWTEILIVTKYFQYSVIEAAPSNIFNTTDMFQCAIFQVMIVADIETSAFWSVACCSQVERHQFSRENSCPHVKVQYSRLRCYAIQNFKLKFHLRGVVDSQCFLQCSV